MYYFTRSTLHKMTWQILTSTAAPLLSCSSRRQRTTIFPSPYWSSETPRTWCAPRPPSGSESGGCSPKLPSLLSGWWTDCSQPNVGITRWSNHINLWVHARACLCYSKGRLFCSMWYFRTVGHYQEEEIGVKGFISDQGRILKESPEILRAHPMVSKGTPEGCSRGHEEIPRLWLTLIISIYASNFSEAQQLSAELVILGSRVQIPVSFFLHYISHGTSKNLCTFPGVSKKSVLELTFNIQLSPSIQSRTRGIKCFLPAAKPRRSMVSYLCA